MTGPVFGTNRDDEETDRMRHAAQADDLARKSAVLATAARVFALAARRYHDACKDADMTERHDAPTPAKGWDWPSLIDTAHEFAEVQHLEADHFVRKGTEG